MSKKSLLLILLEGLLAQTLFAQLPGFLNLNLEDGLPGTGVRCLFRDQFGYTWMGIESKGLCRFDGSKFVTFSSVSSDTTTLSNNFVTSICEDKQGDLWIGTEAGLNLYHRNTSTFSRFYSKSNKSLFDNKINFVKIDSQQLLWIGTDKGLNSLEIAKSNSFEFKRHILPHATHLFASASNNTVNSFFEDTFGNRWFGAKNGLFRYSKDLSELMYWPAGKNSDNGLTCNKIQAFIQIGDRIYIGTNDGVFTFEPSENERIKFRKLSITSLTANIFDLSVVRDQLWIVTHEGLYTFPLSKLKEADLLQKVSSVPALSNDRLSDILLNDDGTIWLASRSQGVYVTGNHASFQIELEDKEVTAVLQDSKGREWIGTKKDGVFVRERNSNFFRQVLSRKECNQVNCIIEFGEELYIGCFNGLVRYHPLKRALALFRFSKVQSLVPLKEHFIVGAKDGVHLFDPATTQLKPLPLATESDRQKLSTIITSVVRVRNTLWIGTDSKGIIDYDLLSKKVVQYTANGKNSGLPSNYIKTLFADGKGTLWIGSKYEGLSCFDTVSKRFLSFRERHGLSNLSVYAIAEDQQGGLWIGTHEGISRFDAVHLTFENFSRIDGSNQSVIMTPNAAFTNLKGEVMMGSQQGLILFHPKNTRNVNKGKFILSSLLANGESKLNAINKDTSVQLSYNENFLQFDFAYIDYLKSSSTSYCYRLQGLDDDWMEVGRADFVTFSKLPAGNYVFQFGIRDNTGKIQKAPFSVAIHIHPYFLASPVAYMAYALIVLFIAVLLWKYILAKQKIKEIRRQMLLFQELAQVKHQLLNEREVQENKQPRSNRTSLLDSLSSLSASSDAATPASRLRNGSVVQEQEKEQLDINANPSDGNTTFGTATFPDTGEDFLRKCYQILEENYSKETFNVAVFSQEIGMSRAQFYSKLKSASGLTPSSMIWEYRLLKAAHFLKDRSKAIFAIASDCGFENISSFSTMFKKRFGRTPSDFRSSLPNS